MERHRTTHLPSPPDRADMGIAPWMSQGACRGEDPELFFPMSGRAGNAEEAISICDGCGVRDECLRYALRDGVPHGIWGGRTEQQRRRILRSARRNRVGLPADR